MAFVEMIYVRDAAKTAATKRTTSGGFPVRHTRDLVRFLKDNDTS